MEYKLFRLRQSITSVHVFLKDFRRKLCFQTSWKMRLTPKYTTPFVQWCTERVLNKMKEPDVHVQYKVFSRFSSFKNTAEGYIVERKQSWF